MTTGYRIEIENMKTGLSHLLDQKRTSPWYENLIKDRIRYLRWENKTWWETKRDEKTNVMRTQKHKSQTENIRQKTEEWKSDWKHKSEDRRVKVRLKTAVRRQNSENHTENRSQKTEESNAKGALMNRFLSAQDASITRPWPLKCVDGRAMHLYDECILTQSECTSWLHA